jgi:hypothetical protein
MLRAFGDVQPGNADCSHQPTAPPGRYALLKQHFGQFLVAKKYSA